MAYAFSASKAFKMILNTSRATLLFSFIAVAFCCSTRENESTVLVKAPPGYIRGSVMKNRRGSEFFAFRGIRYAEPPVNEKRFAPPKPINTWTGTYNATQDGAKCPQPLIEPNEMSEDCLFLNVYTKSTTIPKPVLVYIHGGAFYLGSGSSDIIGPQYLMDKSIVFVTINYRLGPLGFVSTSTEEAPGNYGFKDQVAALKWVQDNIAAFGGDPKRVTIWGQSAGAMSVSLHLVSPLSRGLFHRAIMSSGSSMSHIKTDNSGSTKKLAARANCSDETPKGIVDCLRKLSYKDIIDLDNAADVLGQLSILRWNYEIEENFGQEVFLDQHPSEAMANGDFARVPIIAGFVHDEFAALAQVLYNSSILLELFNQNFELLAPYCFLYESGTEKSLEISQTLKSAYFRNLTLSQENLKRLEELFTDAVIVHGVHRLVALSRRYTNVYYYVFTYKGRYSQFYGADGSPYGVVHTDDLAYLFVMNQWAPLFTRNDPENRMVEQLTSWYTNFVATGDPNSKVDIWTSDYNWVPSNSTTSVAFEISDNPRAVGEPFTDRMAVFDKLFPVS